VSAPPTRGSPGPGATRPWPLALRAYGLGLTLLEPAVAGLLAWRRGRGREDAVRLPERRGRAGRARPAGPLVWMHGASVGETLALLPLAERLTGRGLAVLVTSGTVTSADLMTRRLPPGALHQFVPADVPRYLARFLRHWRPDLALLAESELWPNTIRALERAGVPLVLVNGRLSERSARRWARAPELAAALLSRVGLCLAQSEADAARLAAAGAARVVTTGNLKLDAPAPSADPVALATLSGLVSGRPVVLAASTHPGEETLILHAHAALAARFPGLLTMIVPRHPARGPAVAQAARAQGLAVARRGEGDLPRAGLDVYVGDTVGELGLFYRLSPLAFVGGSLVPHGGQNPIEPARLGCAILHGPHVRNFAEAYAVLDRAGGARPVSDGAALTAALGMLLAEPGAARDMARAADGALGVLTGGLARTLDALAPFLDPLAARAPAA
jgi:3-deoxy-D-manno-octulosonic-acid transferase